VAVVGVALATLLRFALDSFLTATAPFLPFFIVVVAAGYAGGLLPALVATALGGAIGALFLPWESGVTAAGVSRVLFFSFAGMIVAVACEQLHRSRRDAEERARALRDSEARFRVLADAAPMLVWDAGADGESEFSNSRWLEYTGQTPEQARGRGWVEAVHPDDRAAIQKAWLAARRSGGHYEVEYRLCRASDGQYRRHLARAWPQRDPTGKVVRWVGCAADIEDQKRAEDALREADRRKDEFLAVLAHELRNPLAPIRNAAEAIKNIPGLPPAVAVQRDLIERQVRHLARLVDDLMDVSRIARGKIRVTRAPLDLRDVVRQAVEIARPGIEGRRHRLDVVVPDGPVPVEGDFGRLAQVVSNLLNNAAKYTPDGGTITLTLRAAGERAELRVRDTGLGIAPEQMGTLFQPFAQLDRSISRAAGGLGVGLALVRALVELHGGTVTVASDGPNHGAEFTVRLPLTARPGSSPTEPEQPASKSEVRAPQSAVKVLIVDDNEDAAESLAALLELSGYEVRTAFDGRAALVAAGEFRPDAVLLDIGMPGMNGYEVAAHLRADERTRDVVLVALTGWSHEEELRKTAEAGFDHHLVKPVEPGKLHALLTTADGRKRD
jgi:two-component system CheB/CheR fusion protein